jgi:hypothetical protein
LPVMIVTNSCPSAAWSSGRTWGFSVDYGHCTQKLMENSRVFRFLARDTSKRSAVPSNWPLTKAISKKIRTCTNLNRAALLLPHCYLHAVYQQIQLFMTSICFYKASHHFDRHVAHIEHAVPPAVTLP